MTEKVNEPKADAQGDKLDAIFKLLGDLSVRMDEMEKNLPAPPLVTAADKKRKDDDEECLAAPEKKDDDDDDDDKAAKRARRDEEEEEEMKAKDDAGEVEGPAGEIKPDDDDDDDDDDDEDDDKAAKEEEEEAKFADAQAKADSAYSAFGKSAPRPMKGESLHKYRVRMLRGLQAYSDSYKDIKLSAIKGNKLLEVAEKHIYADALAASKVSHAKAGALIEHHTRDLSGRTITRYSGDIGSWLNDFKVPAMRVTKFNTRNNIH
jgi:hypothetical protein